MEMKIQQAKRWSSSLAFQVSPCITLGLLLVASLSARAAGLPCDLSVCLQRVGNQAQHSATMFSGTDRLERLQLLGVAQAATEIIPLRLLPIVTEQAFAPRLQLNANQILCTAARPRAP